MSQNPVPAAEDFYLNSGIVNIPVMLKAFAALHVEAALEAAAGAATHETRYEDYDQYIIDEGSILEAYPLTNIK